MGLIIEIILAPLAILGFIGVIVVAIVTLAGAMVGLVMGVFLYIAVVGFVHETAISMVKEYRGKGKLKWPKPKTRR